MKQKYVGFTLCDYFLFWFSSKVFGGENLYVVYDFASGCVSHY